MAHLAALFSNDVRESAHSYVVSGKVKVLVDGPHRLLGVVRGRSPHSVMWERRGESVIYGCSCEDFLRQGRGCKHLWALAVHSAHGVFVEHTLSVTHFMSLSTRAEQSLDESALFWLDEDEDDEYDDEDVNENENDDSRWAFSSAGAVASD